MGRLQGLSVLLTGGSRGIGPIIAEALAKRGAHLAIAARSKTGLDEVATHLRDMGTKTLIMPVDLQQPEQRQQLVRDVLNEFGKIDILINNAALETEGVYAEQAWAAIQETIEVNLTAPMDLTRLVLPGMLEGKIGYIVNIASIAAKSGAPYSAIYSGTKAGLAEWTRALRLELLDTGIHCSTLFPGYVRNLGMFAKFGVQPPWLLGSCTPTQVAGAVVACIEQHRVEQIVNSRPLHYAFMLNELSPVLGDWLMRVSGMVDFQRRRVGQSSRQ
jgi:short-subunit dehydrogenase